MGDDTGGFSAAFSMLLRAEGGLSLDRRDPGNWTGGRIGRGILRGTKFGISAASFPTLDIAALTQAQAAAIYRHLYWDALALDTLPARLAALLFDTAVNSGRAGAVRLLQETLRIDADGILGPATLAALKTQVGAYGEADLGAELLARRLMLMVSLPGWRSYGFGWARRLFGLAFTS